MTMKIDETYKSITLIDSTRDTATNKAGPGPHEQKPDVEKSEKTGTDIQISTTSLEYNRAAEEMNQVPEARAEKIAEIKTQIQKGTYEIDPDAVADKILDDALKNMI
jgi:flagellar biosynthesis anti-sigma factor FlgM